MATLTCSGMITSIGVRIAAATVRRNAVSASSALIIASLPRLFSKQTRRITQPNGAKWITIASTGRSRNQYAATIPGANHVSTRTDLAHASPSLADGKRQTAIGTRLGDPR